MKRRSHTADQHHATNHPSHARLFVARRSAFVVVLAALLLALAGCSAAPEQAQPQAEERGGSISPEAVTESFFTDLKQALKDPQLGNEQTRSAWVERLATYFAPDERDDQRIALSAALDGFVGGLGKLDPSESLTLEVRFDGFEKISESADRALVQPINGSIYVLITRTTSTGVITLWEQNEPLSKIIGGDRGAVPVIRIDRSWFLSEG